MIAVGTTTARVLESLSSTAVRRRRARARRDTALFIYPGHEFRLLDGLVTNFHLPRSSLLMLVCGLWRPRPRPGGLPRGRGAGYRFYSYGDAMLVVPVT